MVWGERIAGVGEYQGVVERKSSIQEAFRAKAKRAKCLSESVAAQDWSGVGLVLDHLLWAIAQVGGPWRLPRAPVLWSALQVLSKPDQPAFLKEINQVVDCFVACGGFLCNELPHRRLVEIEQICQEIVWALRDQVMGFQ